MKVVRGKETRLSGGGKTHFFYILLYTYINSWRNVLLYYFFAHSSNFWALKSFNSGCRTWIPRWSAKSTTCTGGTRRNGSQSRTPSIRRRSANKTFEERNYRVHAFPLLFFFLWTHAKWKLTHARKSASHRRGRTWAWLRDKSLVLSCNSLSLSILPFSLTWVYSDWCHCRSSYNNR